MSTNAFAIELPEQKAARLKEVMQAAVLLHDQGKFDEAITRYQAVLVEDLSNNAAWYELSYSQMAKGDSAGCIRSATEGLKFPSKLDAPLYATLGSCQDLAGRREEAIDTLKNGVKRFPDYPMLQFNLGVTYQNAGRLDDARKSLRESVRLQPTHPGSHLALAKVYRDQAYRAPALMAALVFLSLEPGSARSQAGVEIVKQCLGGLVQQKEGSRDVNITISMTLHPKEEDSPSPNSCSPWAWRRSGKMRRQLLLRVASAISTFSATLSTTKCKGQASPAAITHPSSRQYRTPI